MRDLQISTTHFEFTAIKELEINRGINDHGTARLVGYISGDNVKAYREKLMSDIWLSISAKDEGGSETIIFTGLVTSFTMGASQHNNVLELHVITGTYLMDVSCHFRTFQDGDQSYKDVLKSVIAPYPKSAVIGDSDIDKPTEELFLQYQETDWSFLKRLASKSGKYLVPSISKEGVIFYFGMQSGKKHKLDECEYTVIKRLDEYWISAMGGLSTAENDKLTMVFTDREIYELFDRVSIEGREMIITGIHTEFVKQELLHSYTLSMEKGLQTVRTYSRYHNGCSFPATVTDVKEHLVQVEIAGDENTGQKTQKWFPYSTVYSSPDGTGWYCMPEKGDEVRLQDRKSVV